MAEHTTSDRYTPLVAGIKKATWTHLGWAYPRKSVYPLASLTTYYINRGKNTGAGAAFVYWVSKDAPDPAGASYTGSVPFGQLTGIVVAGTYQKAG